ncbi:hypothetical protein Tco_1111612 [Tanacetum coccineum]|uniref:Uncharacterized protein n=1 Tax=Tanacetum coccineum TaxID=301880 RepID=A0ABQ5IQK6_9ASTR
MLESKAYQTYYAFASGEKAPKPKYIRKKADSDTSPKKKPVQATKGTRLKSSAKVAKFDKKKQPAKMPKAKGLNVLSEVALTEAEKMKLATKRSKTQFYRSYASGSGDEVDTQSKSEDESWTLVKMTKMMKKISDKNRMTVKKLNQLNNGENLHKEGEYEESRKIMIFDQRVSALESEMYEFRQTSQFAKVVSSILGIVDTYLASKMKEAVDVVVQLQTNKLREEAQAENQEFLNQVDSTMKAIIKEQVQVKSSIIHPKRRMYVTQSLGAKVLVRSTNQAQTSYVVATSLSEFELKKILIDKIKTNKLIDRLDTQKNLYNVLVVSYNTEKDIITSYGKFAHTKEHDQKAADLEDQPHQEFNTGNEDESPIREALNEDVWHRNPLRPPTPDREWHKTKTVDNRPPQPSIIQMAQAAGTQSSFNEFLVTPIDFSAFIMHRLKIDNLTQEVLTDPTYDLIKGMCKSVVELEYHLEEVFKATNDRLD